MKIYSLNDKFGDWKVLKKESFDINNFHMTKREDGSKKKMWGC